MRTQTFNQNKNKVSHFFSIFTSESVNAQLSDINEIVNVDLLTNAVNLTETTKLEQYTGIFVDLDNVIGQLEKTNVSSDFVDQLLIEMGVQFSGAVKVFSYGNLKFHGLEENKFDYENITVEYIDTPVIGYKGKTNTDTIMTVEIVEKKPLLSKAVIVSCDVNFEPAALSLNKSHVPVEIIQFGHTRRLLLKQAQKVHDGFHYLNRVKTAEELVIAAIGNSKKPLHIAKASQILGRWKYNSWQGHKKFGNFLKTLSITYLQVDTTLPGTLYIAKPQDIITKKLKNMGVLALSETQYSILFQAIAKSQLGPSPRTIVEAVHHYCADKGFELTYAEIENVVVKVLPEMNTSSKPQRFASKYLNWLFQKSKVSFGGLLNSQDKEFIKSIVHG
jgi:uncharacterized LabA/DUF88 family protein